MERPCPVCGTLLSILPPEGPREGVRLAFDPVRGRLWRVCPGCGRWHPVPLESRWEALEASEEAFRARGRLLLSGRELALAAVDGGELVRVGRAPRPELAGWRYGNDLPPPRRPRRGFLRRLLEGLPPPPVEGYDPYGFGRVGPPARWFASPFLDAASALTAAFTAVPFAPACPSCREPLPLLPWEFQSIRLEVDSGTGEGRGSPPVRVRCGGCGTEVLVPLREARPALRLGLAVVNRGGVHRTRARPAARRLDGIGGPAFLEWMARERLPVGSLGPGLRVALGMVLDDAAEVEALEREWRDAEELAAIADGELTEVPGFEAFRQRVLEEG